MSATRIAALILILLLAPTALAQPPATDAFGDPLPKGAIARCGTATRADIKDGRPPKAPEVKMRVEQILKGIDAKLRPHELRAMRAIEALARQEHSG
jgi:hypothetical protein